MFKFQILLSILGFSFLAFGQVTPKEHREHGAHVHGGGTLAIAFDGTQGKIEFKAAAVGIVGFEHTAKSESDKKTLADASSQFEKNISKLIQFDPSLGCRFTKDKVEMAAEAHPEHSHEEIPHHGEHANFIGNFNVVCTKSIVGSKLTLDFTSYPGIKDLDITVLAGDLQKSAEAKGIPVSIVLQ